MHSGFVVGITDRTGTLHVTGAVPVKVPMPPTEGPQQGLLGLVRLYWFPDSKGCVAWDWASPPPTLLRSIGPRVILSYLSSNFRSLGISEQPVDFREDVENNYRSYFL
jgi:hypothetical protein